MSGGNGGANIIEMEVSWNGGVAAHTAVLHVLPWYHCILLGILTHIVHFLVSWSSLGGDLFSVLTPLMIVEGRWSDGNHQVRSHSSHRQRPAATAWTARGSPWQPAAPRSHEPVFLYCWLLFVVFWRCRSGNKEVELLTHARTAQSSIYRLAAPAAAGSRRRRPGHRHNSSILYYYTTTTNPME